MQNKEDFEGKSPTLPNNTSRYESFISNDEFKSCDSSTHKVSKGKSIVSKGESFKSINRGIFSFLNP